MKVAAQAFEIEDPSLGDSMVGNKEAGPWGTPVGCGRRQVKSLTGWGVVAVNFRPPILDPLGYREHLRD